MQKREREGERDRERDRQTDTYTHTHIHTLRKREGNTEENGILQMNNFDGPGERPLEISNPW